jgi:ankyrin repeat protein
MMPLNYHISEYNTGVLKQIFIVFISLSNRILMMQNGVDTALLSYAIKGDLAACQRLLQVREADINHENAVGLTSILLIILHRCDCCFLIYFLFISAFLYSFSFLLIFFLQDGCPALTLAAACGHISVCELLLSYGADLNHYDKSGCTALSKAAEGNHLNICKFLIEHEVDVNHTNNVIYALYSCFVFT